MEKISAENKKLNNIKTNNNRSLDLSRYSIFIVVIATLLFLSISRQNFFTYQNIYSIFYGLSIEFYAVLGLTLLLIMGEVDLSVGSVFAFAGIFTGVMVLKTGMPVWVAIPLSLFVCGIVGLINGFFVVKFKINSLMMTIGTMILFRGIADGLIRLLEGVTYPSEYRMVSKIKIGGEFNLTIIFLILIIIILEILLYYNISFRKLYYMGENIFSARLYGIKTDRIKVIIFILSSIGAGIAGILAASRSGHSVHNTGVGLEFKMITAAVLGGASLFGGKGSILRSAAGLLFLATIFNGFVMYNIDPVFTGVVTGAVLIIVIIIDTRINREKIEY